MAVRVVVGAAEGAVVSVASATGGAGVGSGSLRQAATSRTRMSSNARLPGRRLCPGQRFGSVSFLQSDFKVVTSILCPPWPASQHWTKTAKWVVSLDMFVSWRVPFTPSALMKFSGLTFGPSHFPKENFHDFQTQYTSFLEALVIKPAQSSLPVLAT